MPYLPNTISDQQAMLEAIGVSSIDELFAMIPSALRLNRPLDLPSGMGELELMRHMTVLAARNLSAGQSACFLGGGSYDHFIPAVVDVIASRSEFYTAYTPYQAEVSQGTLQAIFEYQTLVTQLTGMDVSNASMYDGATAAVEAALMAIHATGRKRVAVARTVHPETRQVLETYLANLDVAIDLIDAPEGAVLPSDAERVVTGQTACLLVQQSNFFGCLEPMDELSHVAHNQGALLVAIVDPISLGLLKRPSEYGADLVAAEGQGLGCPMSFGGPYLGILACSEKFVRRMPGRLVGETTDRRGKRCYVLTLQTREQHIRREKATSNICTNQGLLALRASVYLALMGPAGMRQVAELCLQKAHYTMERLTAGGAFKPAFDRPVLKEFTLRATGAGAAEVMEKALAEGMLVGPSLGRWYPELADCLLVAVTEKRTRDDIDRLACLFA